MKQKVVVIGAGIAGSAIAAHLAAGGYDVVVIEQFSALHDRGSSHGDSRIYRNAPFEGDVYAAMASRALEGWRRWTEESGARLIDIRGGYDISGGSSKLAAESQKKAAAQEIPHQVLTGAEINTRDPIYNMPAEWTACHQPSSGALCPELTLPFLWKFAGDHGAAVHWNTAVQAVHPQPDSVRVETENGEIVADFVVVAAGSWLEKLLPGIGVRPRIIRNVLCWYETDNPTLATMPVFIAESDDVAIHGMPTPGGQLKLGIHGHFGEQIDPDIGCGPATAVDTKPVSDFVSQYFNDVDPDPVKTVTCLYTELPEKQFLIDFHPESANIIVFSACSGHGFKFAPVYGEFVAQMIEIGAAPHPDVFSLSALRGR